MNSQCACAHVKVLLKHNHHPDGTLSDYWECSDGCGARFTPVIDSAVADREEFIVNCVIAAVAIGLMLAGIIAICANSGALME